MGAPVHQLATTVQATEIENMLRIVGLTVLVLSTQVLAKHFLTPLEIDNAPCKAENIKNQVRYTCDLKGNITCQNGWTSVNDTDPLYPCATPVCSDGCVHGVCEGPDICACDIGWEGVNCSTCINLPGCVHGSCNGKGLACDCDNPLEWQGGLCDIPICDNCVNALKDTANVYLEFQAVSQTPFANVILGGKVMIVEIVYHTPAVPVHAIYPTNASVQILLLIPSAAISTKKGTNTPSRCTGLTKFQNESKQWSSISKDPTLAN